MAADTTKPNGITKESMMNHLLQALPDEDFERIKPQLESVSLKLGKVLYEAGDKMSHIYFPTTAIISLLYCYILWKTAAPPRSASRATMA